MFNERKTAQIAAYLLARAGGRVHVLKLIKLMYLSDRVAMERHGYPLTFDRPVSMPHGPVLSRTLDLMNGFADSSDEGWEYWVRDREGHQVSLARDASRELLDELSEEDIAVLDSVWGWFGHMDRYSLRDYTHDNCPEWKDPDGSSRPISSKEIFLALGRPEDVADEMAQQIEQQRKIAAALAAA